MTHKIQKMLAKNYTMQAKKNRPKAWFWSLLALLCIAGLFYTALYEKQIYHGGRWLTGSVIVTFFSMLYATFAWIRTEPAQLVSRDEILEVASAILQYNHNVIKRLLGLAVYDKDESFPLLATCSVDWDALYSWSYPVMVYHIDPDHNGWKISDVRVALYKNAMRLTLKIDDVKEVAYEEPAATKHIELVKEIAITLPLQRINIPEQYWELI